MKDKTLFIIIFIVIILLPGCSKVEENQVDIEFGMYELTTATEVIHPSIHLDDNNEFIFNYSSLSNYKPTGTYTVKDNILTLSTRDNKNTYLFDIVDNKLVFNKDESSIIPTFSGQYKINDKDEFIFIEGDTP